VTTPLITPLVLEFDLTDAAQRQHVLDVAARLGLMITPVTSAEFQVVVRSLDEVVAFGMACKPAAKTP
jgi:hypothetical protein